MRPSEAAAVVGCTPHQIRNLVRTGILEASKQPDGYGGYVYVLDEKAVQDYADQPQKKGWPRGQKRKL